MKNQRPCPCQEFLSPRETQQIRKRPAENSLKWGFIFVPHEKKEILHPLPLAKTLHFRNWKLGTFSVCFQCFTNHFAFYSPLLPCHGKGWIFHLYFIGVGDDTLSHLGKLLAQRVLLEHNPLQKLPPHERYLQAGSHQQGWAKSEPVIKIQSLGLFFP